jgi:hypothetical protein
MLTVCLGIALQRLHCELRNNIKTTVSMILSTLVTQPMAVHLWNSLLSYVSILECQLIGEQQLTAHVAAINQIQSACRWHPPVKTLARIQMLKIHVLYLKFRMPASVCPECFISTGSAYLRRIVAALILTVEVHTRLVRHGSMLTATQDQLAKRMVPLQMFQINVNLGKLVWVQVAQIVPPYWT